VWVPMLSAVCQTTDDAELLYKPIHSTVFQVLKAVAYDEDRLSRRTQDHTVANSQHSSRGLSRKAL
jgi:hypothetical protein